MSIWWMRSGWLSRWLWLRFCPLPCRFGPVPECLSTHGRTRVYVCGPCVESTVCVAFSWGGGAGWHCTPPASFTSRLISTLGIWQNANRDPIKWQCKHVWTACTPLHPPNLLWRCLWCNRAAALSLAGAALFDVGEANTCGVKGPSTNRIPHAV